MKEKTVLPTLILKKKSKLYQKKPEYFPKQKYKKQNVDAQRERDRRSRSRYKQRRGGAVGNNETNSTIAKNVVTDVYNAYCAYPF